MSSPSPINAWLVENEIRIADNPAVSPDMTLDFPALLDEVRRDASELAGRIRHRSFGDLNTPLDKTILWHRAEFEAGGEQFFILESAATGDCAIVTAGTQELPFDDIAAVQPSLRIVPLYWDNFIALKNFVQSADPGSTIFPIACGTLGRTSLGIGARFTTLHWPAVAWAMKHLNLPLTANQNSVPRELVYDVSAMLEGRLAEVPFPFIGGSVPEGHQGQSVMGMSVTCVVSFLKYGFHRNRVPWGFNADHQPIGGRFDEIENELVEGSLFASYITYDLSPELVQLGPIDDVGELSKEFDKTLDNALYNRILNGLKEADISIDGTEVKRLVIYLLPAMRKMKRRDSLYRSVREAHFTTEVGRVFYRELSIDEIAGRTTPEALAVALAMAQALGVEFQFVAPNVGFRKNFPCENSEDLRGKIASLYEVASRFGVSLGFHSGSGKSAENYEVCGSLTNGNFEVKTSGRYTYEMGVALAESRATGDRRLWLDWYAFTRDLAIDGAFSENEVQRGFAREFVTRALERQKAPLLGVFESRDSLGAALDLLPPSTDHMFWFEYNFLFVLAGGASIAKLGDHGPLGYAQRSRFYCISDEGRLLFAKRVAAYVIFLSRHTGLVRDDIADSAAARLSSLTGYESFLRDISG